MVRVHVLTETRLLLVSAVKNTQGSCVTNYSFLAYQLLVIRWQHVWIGV